MVHYMVHYIVHCTETGVMHCGMHYGMHYAILGLGVRPHLGSGVCATAEAEVYPGF